MAIKTSTNMAVSAANSCGKGGRILVLGLGNILLKDEGVGVHVVERLQTLDLPGNVEVIDGGTAGLNVLSLAADVDRLVIIDALRAGREPGTICKLRFKGKEANELARVFGPDSRAKISLHQLGLIDALAATEKLGCMPGEIVIIGVEPKEINYGLELTEQVKLKVLEIVNTVLEEIEDAVHAR